MLFNFKQFLASVLSSATTTEQVIGNLPVNWPKLLGHFQQFYHLFSMFMCSECHCTSLPVQISQILILLVCFIAF